MRVACLCIVCHRAIRPPRADVRHNPRALFCQDNDGMCRAAWCRSRKASRTRPQPFTAEVYFSRALSAYRREQETILAWCADRWPELVRLATAEEAA